MATNVDTIYQPEFSANLAVAAQQRIARLLRTVTQQPITGSQAFFERISALNSSPKRKTTRGKDIVFNDNVFSRRLAIPYDYYDAILVDTSDMLRTAVDLVSPQMSALMMNFARSFDDAIITGLTGTALEIDTQNGTPSAITPIAGNTIAVNYVETGSAVNSNLTIGKLKKARQLLESTEQIQEGEPLACIFNSNNKQALLRDDKVTNIFYSDTKRIVTDGGVDGLDGNLLGMTFIRSERLPLTNSGSYDTVLVYPQSALYFGWLKPLVGHIDQRIDKEFRPWQLECETSYGLTRMWEERVIQILCDQTA